MVEAEMNRELSAFLSSGVYRLKPNSSVLFIDPVRILNKSYTRYIVSPSAYYSRSFESNHKEEPRVSPNPTEGNRKKRKFHQLNEREQSADQRHKEARPLLLNAHEAFVEATDLLSFLSNLTRKDCSLIQTKGFSFCAEKDFGPSFIDLGSIWQAPLYEISLDFHPKEKCDGGSRLGQSDERKVVPIFNNLIDNDTSDDVEGIFLDNQYIIPRESCFHMSSLEHIHDLIPAKLDTGFNLIVIDPPWENRSARQKLVYPTLPNRYFLSLPINRLTHTEGAIVALWVTNREKLRLFVEKELFPSWGVSYAAVIYWLKVKVDGALIGDLDLFHHRPYECLLVGYSHGKGMNLDLTTLKTLPEKQVVISVPGDYSRKPPVGELLLDYAPGPKPARCIELFARELMSGWTSWGNEPLHFQDARYFERKRIVE